MKKTKIICFFIFSVIFLSSEFGTIESTYVLFDSKFDVILNEKEHYLLNYKCFSNKTGLIRFGYGEKIFYVNHIVNNDQAFVFGNKTKDWFEGIYINKIQSNNEKKYSFIHYARIDYKKQILFALSIMKNSETHECIFILTTTYSELYLLAKQYDEQISLIQLQW